jgi:hypothetical protein
MPPTIYKKQRRLTEQPMLARLARTATLIGACLLMGSGAVLSDSANYPAASRAPRSQPGWSAKPNQFDATAPADEAQAGRTEIGTPISKRTEQCFPAEQRDLFSEVDKVAGPHGKVLPFSYPRDGNAVLSTARDAIRGKNTWILWGEGNEVFWDWVQQHGYGLADFLVLIDSRNRDKRFTNAGLVNQPGMKPQTEDSGKILGLYIDQADGEEIVLKQPDTDIDKNTSKLATRPALPDSHVGLELFEPYDKRLYEDTLRKLPKDGLDYTIYGYPTGIVGLRLFPNPNFFAKTDAAAAARQRWQDRVEKNDRKDAFYTDSEINADPTLVRPFRVSMSCGFCHISPHPLNPPADPNHPKWENMSTTIGNQYWKPSATFVNLRGPGSFLYQFLASQQPGTIDTSLVSTDHINNANTITAIFDVPARVARAMTNRPEAQSNSNLLIPTVEEPTHNTNPRHTPRVLIDGSDSVGVFGALSRVYLNIGAYSEEWKRLHNTVVGFSPQKPFAVETALKNSVYWRTADKYRIPYLKSFFTQAGADTGQTVTRPMRLADITEGQAKIADGRDATKGRRVFVENCAVCHSSKQPNGFSLAFSRDWRKTQNGNPANAADLTLPMDFADWDAFIKSPAYLTYVMQVTALAGEASEDSDLFIKDNFLSNEVRIPITLVGTNSGRAVATNAMRGQMWDNFSSEDYKSLPPVGDVHFFNPFSGKPVDDWGNNDTYAPPGGGPGYYRPASLISLWATAPYLHNNALGLYPIDASGTPDPSIDGRLRAFDDAIDKILSKGKRKTSPVRLPGDLRSPPGHVGGPVTPADGDPGFIYRTPQISWIDFPARFIKPLLASVLGSFWTEFLTTYVWVALVVGALALAAVGKARHVGFILALGAVLSGALLRASQIDTIYPTLWIVPAGLAVGTAFFWFASPRPLGIPTLLAVSRLTSVFIAVLVGLAGLQVNGFINGKSGDLRIGPVPAGTPVNLLMNVSPEASMGDLLQAGFGVTRGFLRIKKEVLPDGRAWEAFKQEAALPLLRVSKCPDFVLDRGHWFAEHLTDDEKKQLKAFLKTL